jgi:hypothetical protein
MKNPSLRLAALLFLSALGAGAAQRPPLSKWQLSVPAYPTVYSIAPAQDGSAIVYAAAANPATGESGAFRSDDGGVTWSLLVKTLPGDTAVSIAVDPRDPARVFAAAVRDRNSQSPATRLYTSSDAGVTWHFLGDYSLACGGEIEFDPTDANRVYVALGCGAGLLTSRDAGRTFERQEVYLYLLRVGPTGLLFAAGLDGVIRSADGENWTELASFPCVYQSNGINALAVDSEGRLLLSSGCRRMIFIDNPGVFDSLDGGASWSRLSDLVLRNLIFDPVLPSSVYAIGRVFFANEPYAVGSDDGGRTWHDLSLPGPASQLALSGSGDVLYAATDAGVYRLDVSKTRVLPPQPRQLPPR